MFFSKKTVKYNLDKFAKLCDIHLYDYQSGVAQFIDSKRVSLIDKHRQKGVTTMLVLEGLKTVCEKTKGNFNKKNVVYVCRNESDIKYKMERLVDFYEKLPKRLKPEITRKNTRKLGFATGSEILFTTNNTHAICGSSIDLEIFDEADDRYISDMYKAAVGQLNKNGKIIISSTHWLCDKLPIEHSLIHI